MSGSIMRYSPQSRTYTPQGVDGRWQSKLPGPVKLAEQGVTQNQPRAPAGPQVLTQKPASK